MKNVIRRYRDLSTEQKIIVKTIFGLCFSVVLTSGKLLIGLFTDPALTVVSIYTFALLLAKIECVRGARAKRGSFRVRNALIALFLFVSSAVYIGFTIGSLYGGRERERYELEHVLLLAFIAFAELGFSIAGILRTRDKGYFYRNIKLINFCISIIALFTTQITILDYTETPHLDLLNAWTGVGIGIFIAACAVYILVAPKIGLYGREHHRFRLTEREKNRAIDMTGSRIEVPLAESRVYGSCRFSARVCGDEVEGDIGFGESLWERMPLFFKILCCILSEILIFPWLFGRGIYFLRTANLPRRLEKKMRENGFEEVPEENSEQ